MPTNRRLLILPTLLFASLPISSASEGPIDVGSHWELMIDGHSQDRIEGDLRRRMHRPTPREVAIEHGEPWEGSSSGYHTVFRDGDVYRMYYRGHDLDVSTRRMVEGHREVVCYAESSDGIRWKKPRLGLVEFGGSRDNNIIWDKEGSHNFTPMKDANPAASADERYKALGGVKGSKYGDGLFAFKSPDGIHWSLLSEKAVITKGYFDSQNVGFWDVERGEYRAYFRDFRDGGRDIKTATSKDFRTWTEPRFLSYDDGRKTQLYTNQVIPYYRAPRVFLGFPTRYIAGRGILTPLNRRIAVAIERAGTDYTDGGFMTGRDGETFHVWGEAFLRPGLEREGRWLYGGNYQAWGLVETESEPGPAVLQDLLPKVPAREISLYASEGGWIGKTNRMRRYTLRLDGFVSLEAGERGGSLLTKPLIFQGDRLVLNLSTSASGGARVELRDESGAPIPGYALEDCPELFGDAIEREVSWKQGASLGKLQGKPIRLKVELKDADLYGFRFRP